MRRLMHHRHALGSVVLVYLLLGLTGQAPMPAIVSLPVLVPCTGTSVDTAILQNALANAGGRPIDVLPGTCVVTATLSRTSSAHVQGLRLRGAGMRQTVFDNRVANGPMISLDGGGTHVYQHGAELSDFMIVTTTRPPRSSGIRLRAVWQVDVRRVWIEGLSGDGVRVDSMLGDADATAYLRIDACRFQANGGYGVFLNNTAVSQSAISYFDIDRSHVLGNAAGGVKLTALQARITATSFAVNGGDGGVYLAASPRTSSAVQHISIRHNEFQSNSAQHIKVDGGLALEIAENQFNGDDLRDGLGHRPPVSVRFGDGVTIRLEGGLIERNRIRNTPAKQPHIAFDIGANAAYTTIRDNVWMSFSDPAIRIRDAGTFTTVRDEGRVGKTASRVHHARVVGASYSPDMRDGVHHRVALPPSSFMLEAPSYGAEDGQSLTIDLVNGSAGPVHVGFHRVYRQRGFSDPAPGQRVTGSFRYSAIDAAWLLVGAWSPPY